jgi:hypothetical protein
MAATLVVDETRLEEIYANLRVLIRELDPELSDDDVEAAITRLFFYAEKEKKLNPRKKT